MSQLFLARFAKARSPKAGSLSSVVYHFILSKKECLFMAHYQNQKTIIIHRSNPLSEKKQYLAIDCQALATAARLLTPSGFKLYLYLASNQNNYEKDYSPRDFSNVYGLSVDAARRAPADLVNCGYIIEENGKLNFYETPHDPPLTTEDILLKPEVRTVQTKNGPRNVTYNELKSLLTKEIPEHEFLEKWNQLPIVEE